MLPGTANPTNQSPTTFSLSAGQTDLRHFTWILTQLQTNYRDLALRYHALPLQVRTLLASNPTLSICAQELTIPAGAGDPLTILRIQHLRQAKDKAASALRKAAAASTSSSPHGAAAEEMQAALRQADDKILVADAIARDVDETIYLLLQALQTHEQEAAEPGSSFEGPFPFPDAGPPTPRAPLGVKYAMLRAFILRLPEARRMREVLGESEASVMSLCTRGPEWGKDRLVFDGLMSGITDEDEGRGEGEVDPARPVAPASPTVEDGEFEAIVRGGGLVAATRFR